MKSTSCQVTQQEVANMLILLLIDRTEALYNHLSSKQNINEPFSVLYNAMSSISADAVAMQISHDTHAFYE